MLQKVSKEVLEQFQDYDGNPANFVGTKEYWEGVFSFETNRDPELHGDFSKLHKDIVDMVIQFCKKHNLTNVDEAYIGIDGLRGSMEAGGWTCFTDSSMSFIETRYDEKLKCDVPDRDAPFLHEI